MTDQTFVIVGASLAGAKAAEALREFGFDGRVVLIGSEAERPYQRPPLSKGYLSAKVGLEKVYLHEEGFYERREIELRTATTVEGIDSGASEVLLGGGERVGYDRLLLATGAEPRRLSLPGADLDGIYYLRTLPDSERLRERIERGGKLVVVGAGWIGCMLGAADPQDPVLDHPVSYDRIPYFYSDQYGVGMEYSGYATHWDEIVFRGNVAGREFITFWLRDERILAGMNVNVWDVPTQIQALIRSHLRVDRDRLADSTTPLTELAPERKVSHVKR